MDIIRLKHSHEMLALFPYLYGFKPKDSVVLVAFKSGGGDQAAPSRGSTPNAYRLDSSTWR
ncbi:hypothetical protein QEV59_07045 [Trueperella pyogenes]|uniref:hypothetical protein n=1 Tax=Trueperella pyogenes TaxID=1661 RepID=UPI00313338A1